MEYPAECVTDLDRVEFCHIAEEQLRLEHNEKGKDYREGRISREEWIEYTERSFYPRSAAICLALNTARSAFQRQPDDENPSAWTYSKETMRASTRFDPDLTAIEPAGRILDKLDPTQDLTTWVEVDEDGDFAVAADEITVSTLTEDCVSYVYLDKGPGYFSGDFEHLFYFEEYYEDDGAVGIWMVATTVGTVFQADSEHGCLYLQIDSYSHVMMLKEPYAGSDTSSYSTSTRYWMTVKRDEAVGTYGTLYVYKYSDAARTTLLDTLTVALAAKDDFRYIYAVASLGTAQTDRISLYLGDVDPQFPPPSGAQVIHS
jgi:hypothetical protein